MPNTNYERPIITWGNSFYIEVSLKKYDEGQYSDFDLTKATDLKVYLVCAIHNTEIPLEYEILDGYNYILKCFVDYRLLHTTSYGIVVEGFDEHNIHFRWCMLPKEGFLVINNTSGQKITDEVQTLGFDGKVGWGITTEADLTNYYTKNETNALLDEKADTNDLAQVATTGDYNDLTNKPTIPAAQVQSDWNQTNSSEVDYIKNKPDLSIYATESELSNYYNKGETDGLLNNKVDTSTLTSDYYNKNTVNNLLDTKADNSDLSNNYYDKSETNTLLNQKANTSDLNDKQDTLVSGTNIKTINNISLLGSGNIDIQGGGTQVQSNWNETNTSAPSYIQNKPDLSVYAQSSDLSTVATSGSYNDLTNKPDLSVYATQSDLNSKQDTLVSGTNIKTINNQSLLGSGNIDIQGGENHDNADEATANSLFELNERLSEAEINIDIIPTEVQVIIDELEANVEQSLDELSPKFDEIDEEFKSTALIIDTITRKESKYERQYLTIVSLADNNTIGCKAGNANLLKTISISTDDGATWTDKQSSTSGTSLATLNIGDKLLIKGSNTVYGNSSYGNWFTSTGNYNVEGNIMSLIYGDNFIGQTTLDSAGYNFRNLFYNCSNLISAENLVLPAITLANSCYSDMFNGCTALTTAPELPATTLAASCYFGMFYNCTSLTTAPELTATTLADYCYEYMFQGCSSLTTAPELTATILTESCYFGMFYGCTALTTVPELPATTLAENCYLSMFAGCTSLTTAPELHATTLALQCYQNMFYGCTALTTAPELPATTLAENCYQNMFDGCTALTTAHELPATTLADHCYEHMFHGCTALNYIKCLATNISAYHCTNYWVDGVGASGTFIKADSMSSWTIGNNGIPSGWNVYNVSKDVDAKLYDLATVATTGNYNDLSNKPTIPAAQVNSDWNSNSGVSEILNKPDLSIYAQSSNLATVATSGSYNDLSNTPTIPDTTGMVTSSTSGLKIEVVAALPASPDTNTIYIIQ